MKRNASAAGAGMPSTPRRIEHAQIKPSALRPTGPCSPYRSPSMQSKWTDDQVIQRNNTPHRRRTIE
jgi:hypothetical protein